MFVFCNSVLWFSSNVWWKLCTGLWFSSNIWQKRYVVMCFNSNGEDCTVLWFSSNVWWRMYTVLWFSSNVWWWCAQCCGSLAMYGEACAKCRNSVAEQPNHTPHLQQELLQILHSPNVGKCQPVDSRGAVAPTHISPARVLSDSYLQQV